ncbi:fatty acid desaturase [Lutimaribacter sp. EGI FJ00015]|uniref:Fatty acid desaturase n=1 Tax=Lutimaribacter degradans TaxID=2945989 RepID=A0ACC5ZRH2_9RHOB|nr:fatty acid desaturase [Lutimaribacter sp. EGI FJ00013]MCM2560745.1 fatty acid desaturase [Lutimaribacter sp. EGI FJ00013]MCO0612309.1 fatty acid desaturase [Lutimaribacter sp. EGI FJ00015]MCO0634570.1 fatty acid desaturase [Lutimaribacter sp. EGI FJ00014]
MAVRDTPVVTGQVDVSQDESAGLRNKDRVEWPTLALLAGAYTLWGLGTTWAAAWWLPAGMALVTLAVALHSSLCHEALHGHPFRSRWLNEALVFPALALLVPYGRFRDTHLAHHHDEILTDPYDDPETNYLDPRKWARLPRWQQALLIANNTLLGRMLLGPAIGQVAFMAGDWRLVMAGAPGVLRAWMWHVPAVGVVLWWLLAVGQMPFWAYLLASYAALSVLKIRTFLEHRAHERARARTVIIEDRGPLALIFLNNNLHVVHHMHPRVAWYKLPALYARHRDHYRRRNDAYVYRSYREIFRQYFLRAKDPVPHPIWRAR